MTGTWGTSHQDNDPNFSKRLAKCQKAETHHHRDGASTSIDAATNLPRIWPRDMMNIIDLIIKLHSPCPVAALFGMVQAWVGQKSVKSNILQLFFVDQ
jgi:hypothetical protein